MLKNRASCSAFRDLYYSNTVYLQFTVREIILYIKYMPSLSSITSATLASDLSRPYYINIEKRNCEFFLKSI